MKLPRLQAAIIRTLVVFLVLFTPYLFSRLMSPFRLVAVHSEPTSSPPPSHGKTFRVAAYNIAHGRGTAASNSEGGTQAERERRLSEIANLLKKIDAEVVILNEVDFDSSWSHGINQAEFLARAAGYPFRVEQRNLDLRFLWMTWRFGNSILSRYPLTDTQLIELPAYSFWESLLVGKKQAISSVIHLNGRPVRIIGAHLSHRSTSLRVESARSIMKQIQTLDTPTILAGDMNSMPPPFMESQAKTNLTAMQVFEASRQFSFPPVSIPFPPAEMTFHSEAPKWMIDWILIPENWSFYSFAVDPSTLSDHRLIYADLIPSNSQP